jgi:hypothetical protein
MNSKQRTEERSAKAREARRENSRSILERFVAED